MKKALLFLVLILITLMWARVANGQATQELTGSDPDRQAMILDIDGPIGPATRDHVSRSIETATEKGAELLIIRMDTPGGLDASTRDIVKDILNSPVPVATWVAPQGARAASAGTYILYASHIAAMSPATNVGAATPVAIIGGKPPSVKDSPLGKQDHPDDENSQSSEQPDTDQQDGDRQSMPTGSPDDPMTEKTVNDAVAYIRGLAEKRGRNASWAERAVREADSITSDEALERGVIDLIAKNLGDLLEQIDGMTVEVNGIDVTLATRGLQTERLEPDWRNELMAVITSPTIAYLLLLIGVYGLILEGYHPGAIVPGVVGAICLLMALYAFQMLPVNYAGLGLIVLGIILMIAEALAPSFGALGFGGIIAMVIGSIILIDTDVPGFGVSRPLIGAIAATASLGLMAIIWFAVKARGRPVVSGREQLIGYIGVALQDFDDEGEVFVHSERWSAITEAPLKRDDPVVVIGLDGLTLKVRPADE